MLSIEPRFEILIRWFQENQECLPKSTHWPVSIKLKKNIYYLHTSSAYLVQYYKLKTIDMAIIVGKRCRQNEYK